MRGPGAGDDRTGQPRLFRGASPPLRPLQNSAKSKTSGKSTGKVAETDPAISAARIESFLAEHPGAAFLEEGQVLFEMRRTQASVRLDHGRCVLALWGEAGNLTRSVLGVEERADSLRILTRRLGQSKAQRLDLVASSARRSPTTLDSARRQYARLLMRVLERQFFGFRVEPLRAAMDLEHSFGPAYARGRMVAGNQVEVVVGVGFEENQATVDGCLTVALLWLELCQQRLDRHHLISGLTVVLPAGMETTTARRMCSMVAGGLRLRLMTLHRQSEELAEAESGDRGNLALALPHAFDEAGVVARFREGAEKLLELVPAGGRCRVSVRANSPSELSLSLHGLEFAHARAGYASESFTLTTELSFGAGQNETALTAENEGLCRELLAQLFASRHPAGDLRDPLYRMMPERWLEERLRDRLPEILPNIDASVIYRQVPATGGSSRGLFDLLAIERSGRLVVVEVKADEDLQLPLQALDYWQLVSDLAAEVVEGRNAFERMGYFPGRSVSSQPPKLVLVVPALRLHPTNETVLRSLAGEVEWEILGLGEDWRERLTVAFRKRR